MEDAATEVVYWWHRLENAKTLPEQAEAITQLSNHVSDLKTWLPGYDNDSGTMPWERATDESSS